MALHGCQRRESATPSGLYPATAVIGRQTTIPADNLSDGHDILAVRASWRPNGESKWRTASMAEAGNELGGAQG